ncbi:Uncharacterized protein DAT39_012307, partial [Clarias magur]
DLRLVKVNKLRGSFSSSVDWLGGGRESACRSDQMDPGLVTMVQGHSRNRSIKAKWPDSRNPALGSNTERGYQINLTLLSEWPHARK